MGNRTLPSGLKIFNATPHTIRFWDSDWDEPIEIAPNEKVDARPIETPCLPAIAAYAKGLGIELVQVGFEGTDEGRAIIRMAFAAGADIVVGSIIAAQAYPGNVVAMIPAMGYERVPPTEKRMRPDKFTVF